MQTQCQQILEMFRRNGNQLTLGQLLKDPSGIGYKSTSRFSDLRKEGYQILYKKGATPSENTYLLIEPLTNGQMAFA